MLTSFALIFIFGLLLSSLFSRMKLPGLLGMILAGIAIGPYALNLLDSSILSMAADLRQAALIIILTRAGLSLDIGDLKRVGRPAVLMCFLPACFEILGIVVFAPRVFGVSDIEAVIMGSVIAAVSPAVIVPRMIKITEEGYGRAKSIPQLILAGASVDDVFVIVLFTAFTTLAAGGSISAGNFVQIPVSILLGIILGLILGSALSVFFRKFHMSDSVKVLLLLSISFLFIELQNRLEGIVPISGLIAIMCTGIALYDKYCLLARRLSEKYNQLWACAEIVLFVLVGAAVDLNYVKQAGFSALLVVLGALVFRMTGVFFCLLKTPLNKKERLFCMIAYTPKATVQAAIGAVPLSMGLSCGQTVLIVAVLSILITAPIGAIGIDKFYAKLLAKQ